MPPELTSTRRLSQASSHGTLTSPEALVVTAVAALAATILIVFGCDLLRVPFRPFLVTPLAVVCATAVGWCLVNASRTGVVGTHSVPHEITGFLVVFGASLVWMLWRSGPTLLPLGSQGDLTHHLQLVDFIERHWRLPRGLEVERYLAEMAHYTPGVHALSALAGRWTGTDGLHVIHSVVSAMVALKLGFVYLVALRVGAGRPYAATLALAASALAMTSQRYVFDSFMRDGFLAQAVSETFVLGMWWALTVWDEAPARWPLALFGLFASAAFLTWPIYVGPPIVALAGLVAVRREPSANTRVVHGAWALFLPAVVATLYIGGRTSLLGMSGAAGAVLRPDLWTWGPQLAVLGVVGLALERRVRPARATVWLLVGIAAQWSALYVQALALENASAYMAWKTLYLVPYPLAALAVVTLHHAGARLTRVTPRTTAALFLVIAVVDAGIRMATRRPEAHAITDSMWKAGAWARDHLPRGCLAYMVPDDDTAYWLHLAVLRNPRASDRTVDQATFDLSQTTLRWYGPGGLPYAIVDLNAVSTSVRAELQELARFDNAVVVGRRGPAPCADEHLPPPP